MFHRAVVPKNNFYKVDNKMICLKAMELPYNATNRIGIDIFKDLCSVMLVVGNSKHDCLHFNEEGNAYGMMLAAKIVDKVQEHCMMDKGEATTPTTQSAKKHQRQHQLRLAMPKRQSVADT